MLRFVADIGKSAVTFIYAGITDAVTEVEFTFYPTKRLIWILWIDYQIMPGWVFF